MMLNGARHKGFLPMLHSKSRNGVPSSLGGRRTRSSQPQQSAGGGPHQTESTGLPSNSSRAPRRGFRWWRWPFLRLLNQPRACNFPWRCLAVFLLLLLCVTVQVFLFMHVTRNAHAYLVSTPILKSFQAPQTSLPVSGPVDPELQRLLEEYGAAAKAQPYVGNEAYLQSLRPRSRGWLNSMAVFPGSSSSSSSSSLHGKLGVDSVRGPLWVPAEMPEPIDSPSVNKTEELKSGGGFYLKLSDALPLDRKPPDSRDPSCLKIEYDLQDLSDSLDASIIITYHNEPMSTLLRSIHSILNFTPPPLIRELILVDDFSNSTALLPGGELDEYLPYLPKTKLIRLESRSGIVPARMRGVRASKAPVVVILDSHIEVNEGWLEPQLARIRESPKSFVFPQTLSIVSTDFSHTKDSGIGCTVSFDWNVQEKSQASGFWGTTDAIPSPMHGGGLVAFRKDTFYEIGGYDEGFSMWGAENVELSFRIWMCGARLECAPCAAVYHIFRSGGTGYSLPPGSVWKNRVRTAQLWMDDYFPLAAAFNSFHLAHPEPDLPDMTKMLELKKRLNCKDMKWFLKNVDTKHEFQDLGTALAGLGDIRSEKYPHLCLDSMGETDVGKNVGLYNCHGQLGNQGFLLVNENHHLRLMGIGKVSRSRLCLTPPGVLEKCTKPEKVSFMEFDSENKTIKWTQEGEFKNHCLTIEQTQPDGKHELAWRPCAVGGPQQQQQQQQQQWRWPPFPSSLYSPRQLKKGFKELRALEEARELATEIRNAKHNNFCLDALQNRQHNSPLGVFWCHGALGTQGFTYLPEKGLLLAQARGSSEAPLLCVGPPGNLYSCTDTPKAAGIYITPSGQIKWRSGGPQGAPGGPQGTPAEQQLPGGAPAAGAAAAEEGPHGAPEGPLGAPQGGPQGPQGGPPGGPQGGPLAAVEDLCLTVVMSPNTPISKRAAVFEVCRSGDEAQLWLLGAPAAAAEAAAAAAAAGAAEGK